MAFVSPVSCFDLKPKPLAWAPTNFNFMPGERRRTVWCHGRSRKTSRTEISDGGVEWVT